MSSVTNDHGLRVGVAGWAIRKDQADLFGADGTHLQRYAATFPAVEINSSFYRPHMRSTYARWAASVPAEFRFAVKVPRAITHEHGLVGCDDLLARFLDEVAGLGEKLGPLLVQLPPSFALDERPVYAFFDELRARFGGRIACEPRHPTWFDDEVESRLAERRVALVAADPARVPRAAMPGGDRELVYYRLHGSPIVYRSRYGEERVAAIARELRAASEHARETWCIFDNTAWGAAPLDAVDLLKRLREPARRSEGA